MVSFIGPLLIILLSNLTSVYLFKKNFSKVLIFTLLFFTIPILISGIAFSTFKFGIIINIIYSLLGVILLIKNKNNKELMNQFKDNYFNTGLIMFLVIYSFLYFYDLNRVFTMWDEKSHWGVMLKEMIRLDNLYSVKESTLMVHKDYPPVLQIFELFWIKLSGSYKEAYALRALHTLELSFIIPFINVSKINFKNIIKTIIKTITIIVIILLTILMFDTHRVMNSIYNDYLLSIIVVYSLLKVLFSKELLSKSFIYNLCIVLVFLLLTKQISIAFYLMILFFYVIMVIKEDKNKKDYIRIIIFLILIPLIFLSTWNRYLEQFEMTKQFVISNINIFELKNIIINSSNIKHIIYTNFIDSLINYKISFFNLFELSYLKSFIFFSLLYLLIYRKQNHSLKLYLTVLIGMVGYAFLMLILYLFCFGDEGYTLASFDRYMDTYLLIEFLIIIYYILIKKKYYIIVITFIILVIFVEKSTLHYLKPAIIKTEITKEEIVAKDIVNKTKENSKVFLLSQDIGSTYQFSVKYYANPRIINLKYYDLPLDNAKEFFDREVNNYMLGYDYLYVVNTTREINNKYDLFRNIKNKELYKIINNNGKVKIKKVE